MDAIKNCISAQALSLCALLFLQATALSPALAQQNTAGDDTGSPQEDVGIEDAASQALDPEEIDALIKRVDEQIRRMNAASEERDRALEFLEKQIDKATNQISAGEDTESALRQKTIELGSEIEILSKDRKVLTTEVETGEDTLARLQSEVQELKALLNGERQVLATERAAWSTDRQALEHALDEQRGAAEDAKLRAVQATNLVEEANASIRLLEEKQRAAAADFDTKLAAITSERAGDRQTIAASDKQVKQLTRYVAELVDQLSFVRTSLNASEAKISDQGSKIKDLNAQLTQALRAKVEELEQYRSDFFGELSKILGASDRIQVVGDRFVLPANLFFASGSATLSFEAQIKLREIATTLAAISNRIPANIDWILRVDGHTDAQPVRATSRFASNWELSAARAIEVVKYLIESGIEPRRLAATGFGEYQPIDPTRDDPNRRIEFKLTEG